YRKCHTLQRTWVELRHPRMEPGAGAHPDTVTVMVKNLYDMTGADMEFLPYPVHTTAIAKAVGWASLMMAGLLAAGFFRSFGPVVAMLFYGSTLLLLLNYFSTSYLSLSYDLAGHVDYIKTLVETHALPDPFGWQSQQPPL